MNEEELNLDLDNVQAETEERLKVKNRFEKLSEKVILTSRERDDLAKAKELLETEKTSISKERDFYKDFSSNITKYPNANEYQDKILEKVKAGYSTEDAMISVLAKEGKLNTSQPETPQRHAGQVEGGSAPTAMSGAKSYNDMTTDEKFSALKELDKMGELSNLLRK